MATIAQPAASPSKAMALGPLLIVALLMASGAMALQSFGIMAETAKAEMGLSDRALAFIQGGGAAIPLVLLSVPIGVLVDRRNRVRLLIAMSSLWTLGTVVTALAPGVAILFLGRMLVGIGSTGALTAALSLSADWCEPAHRGRAMLITTLGKTIGVAAGFAVSGLLLAAFAKAGAPHLLGASAWRNAQWVLAIISAAITLPLFLLREPPRREVESQASAPFKVVSAELWKRRAFLIPLFIGQTSVVMADAAAGIWAAPVLQRSYGLEPGSFAGWLGGVLLVTGFGGAILGGLVADWGQKTGRRGGLLIGAIAAALVGVPAALFPVMPSVTGFAVALGALMLAGTITGLIASVALTVLLPNELRGLSIGAFIAFAGLIGLGIAPALVAEVSRWMGDGP